MAGMRQVPRVVAISALGVAIDISVVGDEAASRVADAWSGARRIDGSAERVVTVSSGGSGEAADIVSEDVEAVLHHLSQKVTQVAIEARAGDLMMLHAAGLADPATGATVALVAPSGTGKTTLCRTLGDEFAYVSDETVGFDDSLTVRPYRKPLSVVRETSAYKDQCSPDALGLVPAPDSVSLAAVVLLERTDQVAELEVADLRTVAALPLLAVQTSYLSRHRRPLGFLADALERTGGMRHVRYRSAGDLRPLLVDLLGART